MASLIPTALTPPFEMEERSPLGALVEDDDYGVEEKDEEQVTIPQKKTEEENDSLSKHEIITLILFTTIAVLLSLILLWASFTP